ncbi:MAG: M14 family zinc carboxypeptidase [bacterium]
MKRMLLLIIICISIIPLSGKTIIRIRPDDYPELSERFKSIDIAAMNSEYCDVVMDEKDLIELKSSGIDYRELNTEPSKADWLTLQEAYDWMDSLNTMYPTITDIDTIGYTAAGNNPMIILKINGSNPVSQTVERGYLLMGNHHAREWQTVSTALFFADSILAQYADSNAGTVDLIDSTFIIVYPVVNPDGYDYSRTVDNMWRKNRVYRNGYYGVDINRNYGGSLNGDPTCDWGYIANGSTTHHPSSAVYCGPYPNSEREVQSVIQLIDDYEFDISISLHSYGELVIWPWGSVYYSAPDSTLMEYIGTEMANLMMKQDNSGYYDPGQSSGLYPTTGDSDDWIYGWSKLKKGRTVIPFTYEIDNSFNSSSPEELDTLFRRVFKGLYRGLELCSYARTNALEIPLKPVLSSLEDTLFWSTVNSSRADFFNIELKDSMRVLTDIENDTALYSITGFSRNSSNAYSGTYSFKDEPLNTSSRILMTNYRTLIEPSSVFTIARYFSLETNYDWAYAEMSNDGYHWTVIDTNKTMYNGAQTSWGVDTVDISGYAGDEYYFRIRVVYDGGVTNEGLYVDNMGPVTDFDTDSLYTDSLSDTLIILGDEDGSYYFTVTPYKHNWGFLIESDRQLVDLTAMIENDRRTPDEDTDRETSITFNRQSKLLIIESSSERKQHLTIYNTLGSTVLSRDFSRRGEINISHLKSGRYFIGLNRKSIKGLLILH